MRIDYTYKPKSITDVTLTLSYREAEVLYMLTNLNILDSMEEEEQRRWPQLAEHARKLGWTLYHALKEVPNLDKTAESLLKGEQANENSRSV